MPWRPRVRQPIKARHLAVALVLLLLAGVESSLWLKHSPASHAPASVAQVTALEGRVARIADGGASPVPEVLAAASALQVGDVVETRPGARVTLRRPGGLTIHLGPDATATWDSADELRLTQGAVYIDTAGVGSQDHFVLVTHAGRIRHVGTRFGVEVDNRHVRVTVRDGVVRLADARDLHELVAGQEGRINADGRYIELPLQADAGPWSWMLDGPARFSVEGRPLREVAHELAAAAGVTLSWSGTDIARDADELLLHGPALDLPPRQALDAVLLTTRFALHDAGRSADGTERLEVVGR